MFFIIWGSKRYITQLAMLTLVCGGCQQPAAHPLRRVVTRFTLFWIPMFKTSTKHILQCTYCGRAQLIAEDEADRLITSPPPPPVRQPRQESLPPQYRDMV